jgi:hypothetical protein
LTRLFAAFFPMPASRLPLCAARAEREPALSAINSIAQMFVSGDSGASSAWCG